jgi:hypothetical protein
MSFQTLKSETWQSKKNTRRLLIRLLLFTFPTKHQKPKQPDHNLTFSFIGTAGICGRDFAEHVHQIAVSTYSSCNLTHQWKNKTSTCNYRWLNVSPSKDYRNNTVHHQTKLTRNIQTKTEQKKIEPINHPFLVSQITLQYIEHWYGHPTVCR